MQQARAEIYGKFPGLAQSFQVTSQPTDEYNCIAWAADDQTNWWWPDRDGEAYWPHGIPREETLDAFVLAFGTLGYEPCESTAIEEGFEKVVIYAVKRSPKHMARQLSSGAWTSKLGEWWDIAHQSLGEIEVQTYGVQTQVLRRAIK